MSLEIKGKSIAVKPNGRACSGLTIIVDPRLVCENPCNADLRNSGEQSSIHTMPFISGIRLVSNRLATLEHGDHV